MVGNVFKPPEVVAGLAFDQARSRGGHLQRRNTWWTSRWIFLCQGFSGLWRSVSTPLVPLYRHRLDRLDGAFGPTHANWWCGQDTV